MTKDAKTQLAELKADYYAAETKMVDFALEHELDLYIDGMGQLLLEDDSEGWISKGRGEWFTSTDSCS